MAHLLYMYIQEYIRLRRLITTEDTPLFLFSESQNQRCRRHVAQVQLPLLPSLEVLF